MKPIIMPFDFDRKLIVLSVVINGRKALRVILDTGMPGDGLLLFKTHRVDEADLVFSNRLMAGGESDSFLPIQFAENVVIDFPGLRLPQQSVLVVDGNPFPVDMDIDGIVGYALLSRYTVKLDFDNRLIRFWKPDFYQPEEQFTELPMTFHEGLPFVPCNICTLSGKQVLISAYLNIGAAASIVLNSEAHEEFRYSDDAMETKISSALGGTLTGQIERIEYMELAGFRLERVIAYSCPGFMAKATESAKPFEASIGTDLLRRFNAVIDYTNKRLLLSPGGKFAEPFHSCISGIAARKTKSGFFVVEDVARNSPGCEAGFRRGDIIACVNNTPANKISDSMMNEILESKEEPIVMLVSRKQVLMKMMLRPRVLA